METKKPRRQVRRVRAGRTQTIPSTLSHDHNHHSIHTHHCASLTTQGPSYTPDRGTRPRYRLRPIVRFETLKICIVTAG